MSAKGATAACSSPSDSLDLEPCFNFAMFAARHRFCSKESELLPLLLSSSKSARGLMVVNTMSAALRYSSCSAAVFPLMFASTCEQKGCVSGGRNQQVRDTMRTSASPGCSLCRSAGDNGARMMYLRTEGAREQRLLADCRSCGSRELTARKLGEEVESACETCKQSARQQPTMRNTSM